MPEVGIKRPTDVTLLTGLVLFIGVGNLLNILFQSILAIIFSWERYWALSVVMGQRVLGSLLPFVLGWGCWHCKPWAYKGTFIFTMHNLAEAFVHSLLNHDLFIGPLRYSGRLVLVISHYWGILGAPCLYGILLVYLLRPPVRAVFLCYLTRPHVKAAFGLTGSLR